MSELTEREKVLSKAIDDLIRILPFGSEWHPAVFAARQAQGDERFVGKTLEQARDDAFAY